VRSSRSPRAWLQRARPAARWLLGLAASVAAQLAEGQVTPAATPDASFSEHGRLDTQVRQVRRPNCWALVIRGRVHNPYPEPVEGVRLVVRLRTSGQQPRDLERLTTDLDKEIAPGASVGFDRELATSCTSTFNDITVVAFALRRGAADLPTPGRDVEVAASEAKLAPTGASDIPIVTSPVVIPNY
jgi:hypothetical protein